MQKNVRALQFYYKMRDIIAKGDNVGFLFEGLVMYEMRLYDWKGKLRWAFIQGMFLVDPLYEAEFLKQEKDQHFLPDLHLLIN